MTSYLLPKVTWQTPNPFANLPSGLSDLLQTYLNGPLPSNVAGYLQVQEVVNYMHTLEVIRGGDLNLMPFETIRDRDLYLMPFEAIWGSKFNSKSFEAVTLF